MNFKGLLLPASKYSLLVGGGIGAGCGIFAGSHECDLGEPVLSSLEEKALTDPEVRPKEETVESHKEALTEANKKVNTLQEAIKKLEKENTDLKAKNPSTVKVVVVEKQLQRQRESTKQALAEGTRYFLYSDCLEKKIKHYGETVMTWGLIETYKNDGRATQKDIETCRASHGLK